MKELKDFCQRYDALVGPSSRMHRRVRHMDYKMWSESDPAILQQIPYEDVKCVEIHMPEDRFRALMEHDEWIDRTGRWYDKHVNDNVSRVVQMVAEIERETRIRHENPAVKKAYEKYLMLLHTVSSHYD